jgi:hypothetical protein
MFLSHAHRPTTPCHHARATKISLNAPPLHFELWILNPHVLARSRFLRPCASRRARFANTLRPHFHHLKPCMSSAGSQTHIASGHPTPVFRFVSARRRLAPAPLLRHRLTDVLSPSSFLSRNPSRSHTPFAACTSARRRVRSRDLCIPCPRARFASDRSRHSTPLS